MLSLSNAFGSVAQWHFRLFKLDVDFVYQGGAKDQVADKVLRWQTNGEKPVDPDDEISVCYVEKTKPMEEKPVTDTFARDVRYGRVYYT